jgi:hypothetical protein
MLAARSAAVALATPVLMRLPLPRLDELLDWATSRTDPSPSLDADTLAAAVLKVLEAGRPLLRRGCLTRGVTLYYCLRRAGINVELSFGMGRVSRGDGFDGHCWLELNGSPYLEPRDPRLEYATMYTCGRRASAHRVDISRA